jgi:hypothetical protein
MPRFFLHLRDGTDVALDEEGTEYVDVNALRVAVLECARDCISGEVIAEGRIDLRLRIDAENAAGELIYRLPFEEAVKIIPG